ncbi:calcium channel flower isoform X1 [Lutzomyia longipalpis]|uniref:calcium channel flower isoform X1 n=1 Tax=Lutzomyia longipalpis TaxID=7200 RepID=UPI0024844EBA|nr:calcium channel flower isoform X1 [Lutzomyia longipalpis]
MASFTEKFVSLMARPGQDAVPKDDVPWYLKYGGRVLGIVAAFFAILFGLYNCLSILLVDIGCLVSGILQICAGMLVMVIEAPCCCMFIDFVQKIADLADSKPYYYRAAVYCVIAIPPIAMCPGLGSLFGCGLIFGTGVIYGMMSLGKKGSRQDMAAIASPNAMSPGQGPTLDQRASLQEMRNAAVASDNSRPIGTTSGMRSNLVDNAQPVAFTGPPAYDSNV